MRMTLRDQAAAIVVGVAIVFLAGVVLVGLFRDAWRLKRKRRHDLDSWFGRTDA